MTSENEETLTIEVRTSQERRLVRVKMKKPRDVVVFSN